MKKHFVTRRPETDVVVALGVVLGTTAGCRPFGVGQGVTASRVRQLAPGMLESDVRVLPGRPLAIRLGERTRIFLFCARADIRRRLHDGVVKRPGLARIGIDGNRIRLDSAALPSHSRKGAQ
jgi:hypothetical protein